MGEYIELTDLWSEPFDYIIDTCGSSVAQGFVDRVNEIKPADVRPVIRGRWINEERVGFGSSEAQCSCCGRRMIYKPQWKFCPWCGATMAGEGDG